MTDERDWTKDEPPHRLWLQWHDPNTGELAHPEERSWSDYRVSEGDPCYVRFGRGNAEQSRLLAENYALRQRAEAAETDWIEGEKRVAELESALDDAQLLADERGVRLDQLEADLARLREGGGWRPMEGKPPIGRFQVRTTARVLNRVVFKALGETERGCMHCRWNPDNDWEWRPISDATPTDVSISDDDLPY